MDCQKKIDEIKLDFNKCKETLAAIGDETRQQIISVLIDGGCLGMRVGEITERTHLSRPAVSHHLKILLDAKVIAKYSQGTMNFYYISPDTTLRDLKKIVRNIEEVLDSGIFEQGGFKCEQQ